MSKIKITEYLAGLGAIINEISPQDAYSMQNEGAYIIDIRTPEEVMNGLPKNALHIPRDHLEFEISAGFSVSTPLLLICAAGGRSLLCAKSLYDMGYENIYSINGGYENWLAQSLPSLLPEDERGNQ